MITALKRLGFDKVFDTNTGADFTIMEEANEFIERVQNGGILPMATSCCPAWVRYAEMNYPENLAHLSSCKSPHQMFGAIIKSYYAKKNNIDPSKIYVVSVMPCIAKKFERTRDGMQGAGYDDVDAVITTRELARMIKASHIEFVELPETEFDNPMGEASRSRCNFWSYWWSNGSSFKNSGRDFRGKSFRKTRVCRSKRKRRSKKGET